MFRRIVCATDFSETADAAARYALGLARTFHGEVELVHAWRLPIELADGMTLLDPRVIAESIRATGSQLAAAGARLGISSTKLLEGTPDLLIVDHAQRTGADLIVTGTRGRTGLAHVLLGSVAERIARTSEVPVLSVPHGTVLAKDAALAPTRILVPVDLEPGSRDVLQAALSLAKITHGRVCAVHAWQMPFYFASGSELARNAEREERARLDTWLTRAIESEHGEVERISRYGAAGDVIREVAAEQKADLVMMATAGRTGIEHFLLGSVTERTMRSVHLPVMTFRRPPRAAT